LDLPPDELSSISTRWIEIEREIPNCPELEMLHFLFWRDGPAHEELKKFFIYQLRQTKVAELRWMVQELTDSLMDTFKNKDKIDWVLDFCTLLPYHVIARLLGFPTDDLTKVAGYVNEISDLLAVVHLSERRMDRMKQIVREMWQYLDDLMAKYEFPENTVMHQMLKQRKLFRKQEIMSSIVVMLLGGTETTKTLMGNTLFVLYLHPNQLQMIKNNFSLVPSAVDETLRYFGPVDIISRRVENETGKEKSQFPLGAMMRFRLSRANKDETKYEEPNEFNIMRKGANVNLAFGFGRHMCPGRHLAKLEADVAITTFLKRFPNAKVLADEATRFRSNVLMGFSTMPLQLR